MGVAVDTNRRPKFEKPRLANPKPPLKRPDLVVRDIRLGQQCKIQVTVANQGTAGVHGSAYPKTVVQLYRNNRPWGGMALSAFDTQKRLKTPGGTVRRDWFAAPNLQLTEGTHTLRLALDGRQAVAESNERNNTLVRRVQCGSAPDLPPLEQTGGPPCTKPGSGRDCEPVIP